MLILHNPTLLDHLRHRYGRTDLQDLLAWLKRQGTFTFPALDNGLFPAAIVGDTNAYTGYGSVWVRDNMYLAYAHHLIGETDKAVANLQSTLAFFQRSRRRFEAIISGQADPNNVMERPHIRFDGPTLTEIDQTWPHAQNDALGYFLWLYCHLAHQGHLRPTPDDLEILALFPPYFAAIRFWEDEDNGHWEETRKIEASSLGAAIAGLQALRQWIQDHPTTAPSLDMDQLESLLHQGKTSLQAILPAECIQPPPQGRRYDAALLFLIYPLGVVEGDLADQILTDVTTHLQGDYGIKRYLGDSFWAPNYKTQLTEAERTTDFSDDLQRRDALLKPHQEAQWCIFDPIVSVIYGQRGDRERQIHHLHRALGQITGPDCPLGAYRCPELYYLEGDRYVANDATPLLWTQANLRIALQTLLNDL